MNKQELLEAVGELNLVDVVFESDGVSYIDTAISVMQVYDLINQLDEPGKVVIPKFVADEFDCNKNAYWEVDEAKDIPHVLKCAFGNGEKPSEFLDWVRDNPEDYVMAVRNGYEVEKENLYYAKLKEILPLEGEWLTNLSGPNYYALDTKGLMLGEFILGFVGMTTKASAYTLKDWERYGINDSNADFVEVAE